MKTLEDIRLKDILPYELYKAVKNEADSLDAEIQETAGASGEALIIPRITELDEGVLELLAWQFHADFYDCAYGTEQKREAVLNSLRLHMKKGTEWAIKEALRQVDVEAEFVPWWKEGGEPYTFRLDAVVAGELYRTRWKDRLARTVARAVEEAKSPRSLMTKLTITVHDREQADIRFGFAGSGEYALAEGLMPHENPDCGTVKTGITPLLSGFCRENNAPCTDEAYAFRGAAVFSSTVTGLFAEHNQHCGDEAYEFRGAEFFGTAVTGSVREGNQGTDYEECPALRGFAVLEEAGIMIGTEEG